MIFNFKTAQNLAVVHYDRNFDMNFHFMLAQKLVAECYERDFGMILLFKAAQNSVAEHYEREYEMIFTLWLLKTWLRRTIKEDRLTGLAILVMNKNEFNLDYINSFLDNLTRKKV